MKYFLLISFFLLVGCIEHPIVPISNTLEIALDRKYAQYVCKLNKAYSHDSTALVDFLKINYLYDAAGYDHGYVLFQLLKHCGDNEFVSTLDKLSQNQLSVVSQYFEVGLDSNFREVISNYPMSAKKMGLKNK